MAEESAKTLLSPYATGNGFDTWKRMMRVRLHQSKLQRTNQLHSSDPKLATEHSKSQEKIINQNSNKLLIAKSSVTLRGANGSWTLGSTASSPKRQLHVYGRATAHQGRTPVPPPPHPAAFPTLGHSRNRTTPTTTSATLLSNTRGLVILSDNIHQRTRKRIQRYSTAKKRQQQQAASVTLQQQRDSGEVGDDVEGEEVEQERDPYATCHMLLLPQSRAAAKARCQEEVNKFSRIMRWLEDCKEAMQDGEFDVDLPVIRE